MTILILIVLVFFASHTAAQSDQDLVDRFDRMYAAQRYQPALHAAETILERHPDSAWWTFNAGAISARLDMPDQAVRYLQRSADLKFSGIASFEHNTDLDALRERADFLSIVDQVRANAKVRMDEFQREAKAHVPQLYVPAAPPEEKSPLIIALHGTGMTGRDMHDALIETAKQQQMILVSPDALRPAGKGFAWTYRDESEWFVKHLIEWAIENHQADPSRVILVGFSQGANIALIMGQTDPELFRAVVPICGHYEPQNAAIVATPAPFYLLTGARDPWKRTYTQARIDLTEAGGKVELRMLTSRGHELPVGKAGTREFTKAILWALNQTP